MLYNDYYIENLLGFKDIILKNVKNFDNDIYIYVEMKVKEHNCPNCNSLTRNIHDYRMQPIKDIPMFGKKTYLKYRKRRYVCKRCGKRFYKKSSFSRRCLKMSLRLVKYIVHQMRRCLSIKVLLMNVILLLILCLEFLSILITSRLNYLKFYLLMSLMVMQARNINVY